MQTKEMKLEQGVKYSSTLSTSHRTKTISLSALEAANILELASDLKGEQAIEDYGIMLGDPSDEQLRGLSTESIIRFYSNVKSLVRLLNWKFEQQLVD